MAYKLCFFVPPSHVEAVKEAIFKVGGGKLGDYDSCAWQTLGQGQYRPLPGANPYQGEIDSVSIEEEYKVEIHCREEIIAEALKAMLEAHPYEEVAYDVIRLHEFNT